MNNVRSAPIAVPQSEAAPRQNGIIIAVALFALVLGAPAWLEGARTTRDGWVLFLNSILSRVGVPYLIPDATTWRWWLALGMMVALGFAYSRVEIFAAPVRPPRSWLRDFFKIDAWHIERRWQVWLVWIIIISTDVYTMYLGARAPRASDPAIFHQIAASLRSAAIYAILITFLPDRLILFGWRQLRSQLRR